jgi:hypothetical protein
MTPGQDIPETGKYLRQENTWRNVVKIPGQDLGQDDASPGSRLIMGDLITRDVDQLDIDQRDLAVCYSWAGAGAPVSPSRGADGGADAGTGAVADPVVTGSPD